MPTPFQLSAIAGVEDVPMGGSRLAFGPPRPNPVRSHVAQGLRLASGGQATIGSHDAAGRLVRRLFDGHADAGDLRLEWDSRDANGRAVPPGLYFVPAETEGSPASARLAVVR